MAVRIIAGEFRGRKLKVEDIPALRPTTDRLRETIFNILASRLDFDDLRVLDLFAGSGALGIEALSRGAGSALFVEKSGRASRLIEENLSSLKLEERGRVMRGDVFSLGERSGPFDLILADPPYRTDHTKRLLAMVPKLLATGGLFLLEREGGSLNYPSGRLEEVLERSVGRTRLTLYRMAEEESSDNMEEES